MKTKEEQATYKNNFIDDEGNLYLIRCAECHRENYSCSVASGMCSWCGWGAECRSEALKKLQGDLR